MSVAKVEVLQAAPPRPAFARALDVLLLGDDLHSCNALIDHLDAFRAHSRHRWFVVNPACDVERRAHAEHLDFDRFDAVVIHFTVSVAEAGRLPPAIKRKLAAYRGAKLQFIQDEYRFGHIVPDAIADLGVHTLFTIVPQERVHLAYPQPRLRGVRKVSTLTGYVPEHLTRRPVPPIAARRTHLGYRGRKVPFWLGSLAQDKVRIAEGTLARAAAHGLLVDVSVREEDRIYGDAWPAFIASTKAQLGTESGASIWDYDGTVQVEVEAYLRAHPGADFATVSREVIRSREGNFVLNAVSPRHFETIALRTPLVMFPGRYDGVVEPDRHYIPLEKDFSNFADVARKVKDDDLLQELADRAYEDVIASGRHSAGVFVRQVDEVLEETIRERGTPLARRGPDPDATRRVLERTVQVMRGVDRLPLGEAALPLVHEASLAADPAAAGCPVRRAAGLSLHGLLLPVRLAEVATRGARAFARGEVRAVGDAVRTLARADLPLGARVGQVVLDGLNRYNAALPAPLAAALRRTGGAARALLPGDR